MMIKEPAVYDLCVEPDGGLVKAIFHYAKQLASWSQTSSRTNSVMEFGLTVWNRDKSGQSEVNKYDNSRH